jgi:hypothetical protein
MNDLSPLQLDIDPIPAFIDQVPGDLRQAIGRAVDARLLRTPSPISDGETGRIPSDSRPIRPACQSRPVNEVDAGPEYTSTWPEAKVLTDARGRQPALASRRKRLTESAWRMPFRADWRAHHRLP